MDITNHTTGEKCHLKYHAYSYFSKEKPRRVGSCLTFECSFVTKLSLHCLAWSTERLFTHLLPLQYRALGKRSKIAYQTNELCSNNVWPLGPGKKIEHCWSNIWDLLVKQSVWPFGYVQNIAFPTCFVCVNRKIVFTLFQKPHATNFVTFACRAMFLDVAKSQTFVVKPI